MKAQLSYLRDYSTENLWVIPTLLTASAIALSFALGALDRSGWGETLASQGWLYAIDPPGARLTLSTIAGSMITVTSLVFSLTILALTVAAQQLGPRLLRSFVRDRVTQVVLGVFLSTFVFSLLVLRTVRDTGGEDFVPYCSLTVAMVLAVGSFGALIFFIHHIAVTIQADAVIANVTAELHGVLAKTFPKPAEGSARGDPEPDAAAARAAIRDGGIPVRAGKSGYIQIIDHDGLVQTAAERDLVIGLPARSGHFVIADSTVALVASAEAVDSKLGEAVRGCILIGDRRTPAQDPEFLFANLVEIAVRALSPGVNDNYTATASIDRLCEVLADVLRRGPAPSSFADQSGTVRLVRTPPGFAHLLDSAFNEIRQSAEANVAILSRLADRLVMLAALAGRPGELEVLRRHGDWVRQTAERSVANDDDRKRVTDALAALQPDSRAGGPGRRDN